MSNPSTQNAPILTVSQLTNAIKICLEGTFPLIWLQGEVSNLKLQTSGHVYFSLKDAQAQIAAVMFRGDVTSLQQAPKNGDQVIIRGEINVYPPKGNYQLIVRELSYAGLGALLLKLEQLKIKLHKKGWFSAQHKKPLPKLPRHIGVVTSPTGAVIQDILNVLTRRFSGFHLILNPVRVQGEGAAQEIAQAIEQFNRYDLADVLIVGRGGGSLEDLWAFNEEIVAEAIFNSHIPIISAVGHETDHCIADYVADIRAPTPSAAAEMVIAEKAQQLQHLQQLRRHLDHVISRRFQQNKHQLIGITKQPILCSPYALMGTSMQRLDDIRCNLDLSARQFIQQKRLLLHGREKQAQALKPSTQIQHLRQQLLYWNKALSTNMTTLLVNKKNSIEFFKESIQVNWTRQQHNRRQQFIPEILQRKLDLQWTQLLKLQKERLTKLRYALKTIDPKNLLKRGYSILFSEKDGSVITSVLAIQKQQEIRMMLSDGEAIAIVKETKPRERVTTARS